MRVDMSTDGDQLRLPDIVIGLGGSGRAITKTMLRQEWVQQSAVRQAARDTPPNFYLIDTTGGAAAGDREFAAEISDQLREHLDAHEDMLLSYWDPLSVLDLRDWVSAGDLVDPPFEEMRRESGVEAWWLSGDVPADEGFPEGTLGQRAIGKAVWSVAETRAAEPIEELFSKTGTDVSVVAGLGGGFGAGTMLDLAARLDEAGKSVTLFAVLPGPEESQRAKTNAFATLSELEYLSVSGRSPFANLVCLPPQPDTEAQEAHQAIGYAVLAHQNLPAADRDRFDVRDVDGPAEYAPFTVAVPEVVRYPAPEYERSVSALTAWLESRETRLERELTVYGTVHHTLSARLDRSVPPAQLDGDAAPAGILPESVYEEYSGEYAFPASERDLLLDRFEAVTELVNSDLFTKVVSPAGTEWRELLTRMVSTHEERTDEAAHELVRDLGAVLAAARGTEGVWTQAGEQQLHRTIYRELTAIVARAHVLVGTQGLDDDGVRAGIRAAIGSEDGDPGQLEAWLDAQIDELEERMAPYRVQRAAIEAIRTEVERRIEVRIQNFSDEVRQELLFLTWVADHGDRVHELLDDIERTIEDHVRGINTTRSPDHQGDPDLEREVFEELNHLLAQGGIEPVDDQPLRRSLEALTEAKRLSLKRSQGVTQNILSGQEDWQAHYDNALAHVDERLFSTDRGEPFTCRFEGGDIFDDRREAIQTRKEAAISEVTNALTRAVVDVETDLDAFTRELEYATVGTPHAVADLEAALPTVEWPGIDYRQLLLDEDETHTAVEDRIREALATSSDPEVLFDLIWGSGTDANDTGVVRAQLEEAMLDPVRETAATVRDALARLEDQHSRLRERRKQGGDPWLDTAALSLEPADLPAAVSGPLPAEAGPGAPVRTANGAYDFRTGGSVAGFDADAYSRELTEWLDRFVRSVAGIDSRVGLRSGRIPASGESADGSATYDQHRVVQAYLSRFFEGTDGLSVPFDDYESVLDEGIETGTHGVTTRHVGWGGRWDTAAVTFVGGVLLDNLREVGASYLAAYEASRADLGSDIRSHHAHGLDGRDPDVRAGDGTGGYVFRSELLDVTDPSAVEWLLTEPHGAVGDRLREEFLTTQSFRSTIE